MPAKSKAQQQLMGMALAAKRGEIPESKVQNKSVLDMSEDELRRFASSKRSELPEKVPKKKTRGKRK